GSWGCRFLPPGAYKVRLRAGGGAAVDTSLEARLLASGSIFGTLGPLGAGARVWAQGPAAGLGQAAVADSSGAFRIYGLLAGSEYAVAASTEAFLSGRPVTLTTAAYGIAASLAGSDAGALAFSTPSLLRVSVALPVLAPEELWGTVSARGPDGRERGAGSLHFSSGAAVSDDGGRGVGRSASTWTVLGLSPGTYDLEVRVAQLGLSTSVKGAAAVEGGVRDLALALSRKADLYGTAALPMPVAEGAWVSIQATREGDLRPSRFGGASIPASSGTVAATSAAFALYGLDPGTWTVQAQARNFISTSARVSISGAQDIGNSAGLGGLDLALGLGSVLSGTVTVRGDSRSLSGRGGAPAGSFAVFLSAYDPASFVSQAARVLLATSAVSAASTFSITGLSPGMVLLDSSLEGFERFPPSAVAVRVGTAGAAAELVFIDRSARALLEIWLSSPAASLCRAGAEFKAVNLAVESPEGGLQVYSDLTRFDGVRGAATGLYCSSMTFLSPPLAEGVHGFHLAGPSGARRSLQLSLAHRATAQASVDLSASTFTVSGILAVSGEIRFPRGDTLVSVSSVPGLLAFSSSSAYCLLSSTLPVSVSRLHVELVPVDLTRGGRPGRPPAVSAACLDASIKPDIPGGDPPGLLAYLSTVSADGSFRFEGVSEGLYLLRGPGELDGDASNGVELAERQEVVRASASASLTLSVGE
ncbi:MAG: hypothetical protein AAB576_03290, partial [Elusimicrobiota bacterium]